MIKRREFITLLGGTAFFSELQGELVGRTP
jgi:hypothetical protein